MERTEQGLLGSRLRGLAAKEVGHGKLDVVLGNGCRGSFEIGEIRDARRAVGKDLLSLEMLDQRIEARVLGNDVKEGVRLRGREDAYVVGDVEVQRVAAGRFEGDVFGVVAEWLQHRRQRDRDLRLIGAKEHLDLERAIREQAEILRLDVLEID